MEKGQVAPSYHPGSQFSDSHDRKQPVCVGKGRPARSPHEAEAQHAPDDSTAEKDYANRVCLSSPAGAAGFHGQPPPAARLI